MQFRMRELQEDSEPLQLKGEVQVPDLARENVNVEAVSSVHVVGQAGLSKSICHVTAVIDTTISYRCSRCLTVFPTGLKSDIDELFTERMDKSDEDIHLVTEWVVLDPYVEEAAQLALDIQPLCKPDCKGLCPTCGQDLNTGTCSCKDESVDPRLEALRDLLSGPESE